MTKFWETDGSETAQSYYISYCIPKAAAPWCKVPPDQVDEILDHFTEMPRDIYTHSTIVCLEPRCRAIHDAISIDKYPAAVMAGDILGV